MTARQLCRRALLKAAAAPAPAAPTTPAASGPGYSVAKGDTLSSIAARNGTTWQELAKLNGLKDPNRIGVGQRLRLPAPPAAPAAPSTPTSRLNQVAARLHKNLHNTNLEAGILANFDRETGGRFDYATKEVGGGGYGLPQYTGASLKGYRGWLAAGNRVDSADSQVDYFTGKYMPSRAGYRAHTAPGAQFTKEQYADWLHRRVFTPAHTIPTHRGYSVDKINRATQRHNDFMKNRLRLVDGVWQGVGP